MRKFFLIPLMTLVCSVMAWGSEITVNNFADLKTALSSEGTADVVKLGQDIAYPSNGGSDLLDIQRSLTLDGQGHQLSGYAVRGAHTGQGNNGQYNKVTLVVNHQAVHSGLTVTLKDLAVEAGRVNHPVGVFTYDGIDSLAIVGCTLTQPVGSNGTTILYYGESSTPLKLFIQNSTLSAKQASGSGGYGMEVLKPIKARFENSVFEGFCSMTFKYPLGLTPSNRWCVGLGTANIGARGTTIKATNCQFLAPNVTNGVSNSFGTFVCEEDGITLDLVNCGMNAQKLGTALQKMFYASDYTPESRRSTPLRMTISGDNSHINGNFVDNRYWVPASKADALASVTTPITNGTEVSITITGGTYSVDPRTVKIYHDVTSVSAGAPAAGSPYWGIGIDEDEYEVKTITMDGVANPLYRVVKKVAKDGSGDPLYDLNDAVETTAEGANPVTSFELSTGTEMKLDEEREVTTAGYVQVKDNGSSQATVVKVGTTATADPTQKVDQTLVINNGLDVQGNSKVEVQAGSALVIGEGGIVTSKPENIVIEADKDGAATLLMDPTITVNRTPELTVKMVAQNVGKISSDYYWHRFALPVDEVHVDAVDPSKSTWIKDGHSYGTLLYKWDYENNEWASLTNVSQMQPFYGYTMTITEEVAGPGDLKDAGYIFKGKLTGNVNSVLNFSRQGYNFFGNSYTGYISIVQLIEELIGNENLDGTVWMWNSNRQQYEGIALNDLKNNPTATRYTGPNSWKQEVAPMQTFILRLMTTDTDTKANINYATAVWGNPRYEDITGVTPAPARRVQRTEDAYVRIVVSAANGKADAINFQEDANLSDANDRGYDAAKYMNERTINVYSTIDGENFGTIATDNLEGKKLTINTIDEIAYTISFEDVEGNAYALRDNVTGAIFAIEEGATYEFTAQPNSIVEGRFEIVAIANVPTAIENTEVKANVKGIYTIMGQYLGEDFDILPAGVYVVNGVKIVK